MSRKTISTIAAAVILTLVGLNAASAAGWDSYRDDDTVYLESNYVHEDQDPENGTYYKPTSYFIIEGDELYVFHAERPYFFLPVGPLPSLNEDFEAIGQTFLEYLELHGFEWDTYDLEDVQQIVFLGSEIGDLVHNDTDIPSIMHGGEGRDWFIGGSASDTLYGNEGDDVLYGGAGDDELVGGTGDDLIRGDGGNDSMFGNQGIDDLRGGEGADYYDYGFDKFEMGPVNYTSEDIDTIVVNYQKSLVNGVWVWQPKIPRFITGEGPMKYSESYLNQRMVIKKRYVTKYGVTFSNPDPTRKPSGIDTSQIDLR